jgi:hypothetical protein
VVAGVCMDVLAAMAQGGPSNRTQLVQEVRHTSEHHIERGTQMSHCRKRLWLTLCGSLGFSLCVCCMCRSVCCW